MIDSMKALLLKLWRIVYPPTKAKLHGLVSIVGTAFAAFSIFELWYATLGLSTGGKIGATLGMLTTYAASWNAMRPKLDKVIDGLAIPDGSTITQTETAMETKTTTVTTPSGTVPTGVDHTEDITGVARPRLVPTIKPPVDPTG
jgi:ABC-type uncharacterized transport system permease subunit